MDTIIRLECVAWAVLGPMNVFKVAYVNKGSPMAQYIVVPPAETCQAACDIARMWACLFWSLQTVLSVAILRRKIDAHFAALAKIATGVCLLTAYFNNVVREPVAIAGAIELGTALLLLDTHSKDD